MKTIKAEISENGNGLPSIGDMVYDPITDTLYRVAAWDGSQHGSIRTNGPGQGNSVAVLLEEIGSASDTTEDQWQDIAANNYGVHVSEPE